MPALLFRAVLPLAASLLLAGAASAEPRYDPGASDTTIKIGNIMPYSGPPRPMASPAASRRRISA